VFHVSIWEAWSFAWGAKPTKAPPWRRDCQFLHLNSIHSSVYIGMRFHRYIFFTMFCVHSFLFFFSLRLFGVQLLFLNTCQKVINGLVDQMTTTVFRQSYMTQRPSLFTLISYCAIVFSVALMFANGCFTACGGFYCASACWLSHMKQ